MSALHGLIDGFPWAWYVLPLLIAGLAWSGALVLLRLAARMSSRSGTGLGVWVGRHLRRPLLLLLPTLAFIRGSWSCAASW